MSFGFREQFWQSLILFYPWVNICRAGGSSWATGNSQQSIRLVHTARLSNLYFHILYSFMYEVEFQRALKLIHDLKFWLVNRDGFLWQRPASSCPWIRLYSRMYQKQHWDTVPGQSHPLVGQDRSNSGSSFIPSCLHLLTLLWCYQLQDNKTSNFNVIFCA